MITFASPLLHAAASSVKDYISWLEHIAGRAPTIKSESQDLGTSFTTLQRVQMGGSQGTMLGSSWVSSASSFGAYFSGSAGRAVQHGMVSEAAYNSQRSALSVVICGLGSADDISLLAVARNGYTSLSGFRAFAMLMDELSYWDFALGKPMTMNPRANTGPVDYASAGW